MNTPNQTHELFRQTDQMYYMYRSDLFPVYQMSGRNTFSALESKGSSDYDFTSDLINKKPYFKQQTVEDVIRHGYLSIPKTAPETAIISDKKRTAWLGLDDIIGQVRHRFQVYQQNIYELELSKCAAINCLHKHRAYHGPTDSKVEYSVNKRLDGLYSDQREERVNLWRDISRLKLLLPENAQHYLSAHRKAAILKEDRGDSP